VTGNLLISVKDQENPVNKFKTSSSMQQAFQKLLQQYQIKGQEDNSLGLQVCQTEVENLSSPASKAK
jgi:hypothetical protein